MKHDRAKKIRRLLRFLLIAFATAIPPFIALGYCLDSYGREDRARPADAIVVLGSKVMANGFASPSLRARTMQAVALYKRGLAHKIICSGGVGTNPPAEAVVAATLSRKSGVKPKDILLEARSRDTKENAEFTARICREHNWKKVIVVSDAFHLWRAQRDFERAGLIAYPSPALDSAISQTYYLRAFYAARETLAVIRDVALGG